VPVASQEAGFARERDRGRAISKLGDAEGIGSSFANGGSGATVVTPAAIGQSKPTGRDGRFVPHSGLSQNICRPPRFGSEWVRRKYDRLSVRAAICE
jgi:hypothetical protein